MHRSGLRNKGTKGCKYQDTVRVCVDGTLKCGPMNTPKAGKIAGVAFVGFIATAFAATKFDLSPATSQLAGFVGAFLGSLAANFRRPRKSGDKELRHVTEKKRASNK